MNTDNNNTNYDKEAYKQKKREQLQKAYNIIDEAVEELQKNPEFLKTWLDVQSRFDVYSSRNALLIAKQLPNALQLKDYGKWKNEGIIFKQQYPNKILLIEPGKSYTNKDNEIVTPFNAKEVIDIKETILEIEDTKEGMKYNAKNYEKRLILQSLVHNISPVVKAVDNLENGKMAEWNQQENTIYVLRTESYDEAIKGVVKELAKAKYFPRTGYDNINTLNEEQLKNFNNISSCIEYLVDKRYGLDVELTNKEEISKLFSGMETVDVKNCLEDIKSTFSEINNEMSQNLEYNDRQKENQDRGR